MTTSKETESSGEPARDRFDDATALVEGISFSEMGGDPVCWAHLLCPSCGVVWGQGSQHAPDCPESDVDQ